jgi:phosphoglycolate phosphatase
VSDLTASTGTPKLLIFDWDGTLSDSVARIAKCMQMAAQEYSLQVPTYSDVAEIVGLGLHEATIRLFPGSSHYESSLIQASYSKHYRSEDHQPCDFFPGVMETLHELRDQGYQLAVATGKSRAGLDRVLAALDLKGFFHSSRCADETLSKPHPLMLEELLSEFGVSAPQAVMVGDTEFDMQMAENAAMPRIAVSYGAHHIDRLRAFKPLACIDLFADIKQAL